MQSYLMKTSGGLYVTNGSFKEVTIESHTLQEELPDGTRRWVCKTLSVSATGTELIPISISSIPFTLPVKLPITIK